MRSYKYKKQQRITIGGMTLIEVLVALFILSTGIIGAVAMQASAKKGSFDAMQRSMASSYAQDIIERMRGNDTETANILDGYNGSYGVTPLSAPSNRCSLFTTLCTPQQIIANDLFEWEQSLIGANVQNKTVNNGGLLGVVGCIQHTNNVVLVAISWEGRVETSDGHDTTNNNAAFATKCGSSTKTRRQIVVNAFMF